MTKDSSYIKKYVLESPSLPGSKKDNNNKKQNNKEEIAIWNDKRTHRQKQLATIHDQRNPEISKGVDWSLVWLWLLLSAVGIMAIFGVTYHDGDQCYSNISSI